MLWLSHSHCACHIVSDVTCMDWHYQHLTKKFSSDVISVIRPDKEQMGSFPLKKFFFWIGCFSIYIQILKVNDKYTHISLDLDNGLWFLSI